MFTELVEHSLKQVLRWLNTYPKPVLTELVEHCSGAGVTLVEHQAQTSVYLAGVTLV